MNFESMIQFDKEIGRLRYPIANGVTTVDKYIQGNTVSTFRIDPTTIITKDEATDKCNQLRAELNKQMTNLNQIAKQIYELPDPEELEETEKLEKLEELIENAFKEEDIMLVIPGFKIYTVYFVSGYHNTFKVKDLTTAQLTDLNSHDIRTKFQNGI